ILLFWTPLVGLDSIHPLIKKGDKAFNQQHYTKAKQAYQKLLDEWGKEYYTLKYAQLLNNLAAVEIAQKHYHQSKITLRSVNQLKQSLIPKSKRAYSSDNLVQNGGFEEGIVFPWGTGHYERNDGKFRFGLWWNSMNAKAYMKIDTDIKHSGERSLQVGNASPSAPHVFSTLSQRITGLQPNQVYRIEYYLKAKDLRSVSFAIDPGWNKRLPSPPAGTYDWRHFEADINIGHNDFIDFRILALDRGTFWIDDIRITLKKSDKDPFQQAQSLYDTGKYKEALALYLKLAQDASSPQQKAYAKWLGAKAQMAMGNYTDALSAFKEALKQGYKHAHIDLGKWAMELGNYEKAEYHLKEALDIVKGDQNTLSLVLNELSRCYLAQERYDDALDAHQKAYRILHHIDNAHGQALALNQLGKIYLAQENFDSAKQPLEEALQRAKRLDDPWLILETQINLAWLAYHRHDLKEAKNWLNQALFLADTLKAPTGKIRTFRLYSLAMRHNNPDIAIVFGKLAVNGLQKLRSGLVKLDKKLQQLFLQDKAKTYEELADILIQQGRLSEAQLVLAMLKEEEYYNFVRRDSNNTQESYRLQYNTQEQRWNKKIADFNNRFSNNKQIVEEFAQWLEGIKPQKATPKTTLNHFQKDMQSILQNFKEGVVLVHYLTTQNKLHILVSTPKGQKVHTLKLSKQELNKQIVAFRRALLHPQNDTYLIYAKRLHQSLIKPLIDDLKKRNVHTLILSLNGQLRYIPFATLHDGKEFLIQNYALVNFTDAAKGNNRPHSKESWRVAGLGHTQQFENFAPLPSVADELEAIVKHSADDQGIYGGVIYLNDDFHAQRLLQVLGGAYPILHIASHFVFEPGTEENSYLLLGNGKHLDLGKIRRAYRFPNVDMLTLSACETALGGSGDGREIEGFGVLAQRNGAKSVIASLWSVDDTSTSILMQQFYRFLHQGHNKAKALQLAQLSFIPKDKNAPAYEMHYSHPYYWAAFILMGNWQ
ncbi:MAG: CHAT domain-containing protein, partial [Campylobacterales bacterium]|nr:CHAT domain-containing protein [Campylobacterales bacterium]